MLDRRIEDWQHTLQMISECSGQTVKRTKAVKTFTHRKKEGRRRVEVFYLERIWKHLKGAHGRKQYIIPCQITNKVGMGTSQGAKLGKSSHIMITTI